MFWWISAFVVWAISAAWIIAILAEVFRGKSAALSPKLLPGYGFHGVTAILSLWLFMKALS